MEWGLMNGKFKNHFVCGHVRSGEFEGFWCIFVVDLSDAVSSGECLKN